MNRRVELQSLLETLTKNVYYQPPSNMQINYPAIIYTRRDVEKYRANNKTYKNIPSYSVTVIDKNPDSVIAQQLMEFEYCNFDRQYVSEGLNHITFILYY